MAYIKKDLVAITKAFENVLDSLGLDKDDPNLQGTPKRLAKMFSQELFKGLYEELPEFPTFPKSGNTFIYTKVPFTSICAHHFQPIKGLVHIMVDYSSVNEVLGLSKFNRIVNHFAKRPTLQEDLTISVAKYLQNLLATDEIFIGVEATHHCVTDRGVCAAFSDTFTEVSCSKNKEFNEKVLFRLSRGKV